MMTTVTSEMVGVMDDDYETDKCGTVEGVEG